MKRHSSHRLGTSPLRAGFTLIELLIVMGIIIVLSAMAVMIVPSANENRVASRGADNVQGWLMGVKHRALRDQLPRGLRFVVDQTNPTSGLVSDIQYLEQPQIIGPSLFTPTINPNPAKLTYGSILYIPQMPAFVAGQPEPPYYLYVIGPRVDTVLAPGDFIEITGGSRQSTHRITNIARFAGMPQPLPMPYPANAYPANSSPSFGEHTVIEVTSRIPAAENQAVTLEGGFIFHRQARLLQGEPNLILPKDVYVFMNRSLCGGTILWNTSGIPGFTQVLPAASGTIQSIDIMFAPSGQASMTFTTQVGNVVATGPIQGGKIALWIQGRQNKSAALNYPDAIDFGEPTLMTIYARTGSIVSHTISEGPDPFLNTKDGKGSGL